MFWVTSVSSLPRRSRLDERRVPGVGLGRPGGVVEPVVPGLAPDLGVGHVVLQRGPLLGLGVAGPHARSGPRKSGMPLSVLMPAPGEHDDALRLVDPRRGPRRPVGSGRTARSRSGAPLGMVAHPWHTRTIASTEILKAS